MRSVSAVVAAGSKPGGKGPRPRHIDLHVGRVIRQRRKTAGLSQAALAEAIGVSFQQVQKYEQASNRVSASVLYGIAQALGCEPGDLFAGLPPASGAGPPFGDPHGFGPIGRDFLAADGGVELARAFLAMSPPHRKALRAAARALADARSPTTE